MPPLFKILQGDGLRLQLRGDHASHGRLHRDQWVDHYRGAQFEDQQLEVGDPILVRKLDMFGGSTLIIRARFLSV
jgi:hypothetical protein